MSLLFGVGANGMRRFPRVSGDEPQTEVTEAMEMRFSPRERG